MVRKTLSSPAIAILLSGWLFALAAATPVVAEYGGGGTAFLVKVQIEEDAKALDADAFESFLCTAAPVDDDPDRLQFASWQTADHTPGQLDLSTGHLQRGPPNA